MISTLLLTAALASPAPFPPIDLLVRVGHTLSYYGTCTLATDILEPAAVDDSYLTVTNCQFVDQTTTNAPSWVIDQMAAYGETELNGIMLGRCWLIHQELIGNGTKAITLECKPMNRPASAGVRR